MRKFTLSFMFASFLFFNFPHVMILYYSVALLFRKDKNTRRHVYLLMTLLCWKIYFIMNVYDFSCKIRRRKKMSSQQNWSLIFLQYCTYIFLFCLRALYINSIVKLLISNLINWILIATYHLLNQFLECELLLHFLADLMTACQICLQYDTLKVIILYFSTELKLSSNCLIE